MVDALALRKSRNITLAAMEQFEEKVNRHVFKLGNIKRDIDSILMDMEENPVMNLERAKTCKTSLNKYMLQYEKASAEYVAYLRSQRHEASTREEASRSLIATALQEKVTSVLKQLNSILPNTRSQKSAYSQGSSSSRLTSVVLQHTAKVEEARMKLKYAKEEADLMRKEAEIKAAQRLLTVKKEFEAAQSSLTAIKKCLEYDSLGESYIPPCENDLGEDDPYQTDNTYTVEPSKYQDHCEYTEKPRELPNTNTSEHTNLSESSERPREPVNNYNSECSDQVQCISQTPEEKPQKPLNPTAPEFVVVQPEKNVISETNELAKLLAKKQLIPTRLTAFDDVPGHYLVWKSTFENVTNELGASVMEKLDLLIQNLGMKSKQQALNIRSANPHDPSRALRLIWERLDSKFGSPESIESSLKNRVAAFPTLKNSNRSELFELADILMEIESIMQNEKYAKLFSYYDSSGGINPIVRKLPPSIQEKWTNEANKYKQKNSVIYPPFSVFSAFVNNIAKIRNDPSFIYETTESAQQSDGCKHVRRTSYIKTQVSSRKTDVTTESCPVHGTNHTLNACRQFRIRPLQERKDFIRENGFCFKCCGPKKHFQSNCKMTVKCDVCNSSKHPSALHPDLRRSSVKDHEGEKFIQEVSVTNKCTKICNTRGNTSKSCAKIILVRVYPQGRKNLSRELYCMIDEQSNRSLAVSQFFNAFGECGSEIEYVLSSCAGKFNTAGRRASGYMVESIDGTCTLQLPDLIECNDIPNNREEIPSPGVAQSFPHLNDIAHLIPPLDKCIDIELLIGRDLIMAHHVLDHRIGKDNLPYGQQLPLGWVIIGNVCLGTVHSPDIVNVNKTTILSNGRPTMMIPCDSEIKIDFDSIFRRTDQDEKPGLSVEDKDFLNIIGSGIQKTDQGHWMAPLPFRSTRRTLPNNKEAAERRARSFDASLKHNGQKREHVIDFMQKLFDNNHAEKAPDLDEGNECWYLPLFGVYHTKKPDSIRMVFDSSAKFCDVSLNDVLLKGPDLSNSLLGILMRFRKEAVAVTMDVEQMFYNFKVSPEHRDFLRFLWHEDNDFNRPLTTFRMTVHVFGNSPSPSVATYGLRKSVESSSEDVKDLINNNFYVDDGLLSCFSEEEAISLVHRTKGALNEGGKLRLHKFASNSRTLLDSFPSSDLAKNLKDLDLGAASLPLQRSLGLLWDTDSDVFLFKVSDEQKPFTKRGALSIINSIYDPIGFAQPVIIRGKILLRNMVSSSSKLDWDDPLPDSLYKEWKSWVRSLPELEEFQIPRQYSSQSFEGAQKREVHIFADASKEAIAAVAFLKLHGMCPDSCTTSFLLGKAKVAPFSGHTVPRLELCAAVLAVQLADVIHEQLKIDREHFSFYSDSQVVLGYITNENRRFYIYVGNRVSRIRMSSQPSQWNYIASELNPADVATRSVKASQLADSMWIKGPDLSAESHSTSALDHYPLINPEIDKELQPEVRCFKTEELQDRKSMLGVSNFTRFSDWRKLVRAIAYLKTFIRKYKGVKTSNTGGKLYDTDIISETEHFIIQTVQKEAFGPEIQVIREGRSLNRSSILSLSPVLGPDGLLRVGGRLKGKSIVDDLSKHPIIIPKNHHLAKLLIHHFHCKVSHQGRHFTDGAVRAAGFWIVGSKRMISSEINKCVICRKLRGKLGWQQMACLPEDRVTPSPPFSYVGVDTFGPWAIVHRRTRGSSANQKRWALLFTCMVTRAVHIEVIEELSSAAFINALRRFVAIRGPVIQFRSDRGTNFIGATQDLSINAEFVEKGPVGTFLSNSRTSWVFNPPHASHMGGAWERLIGVSRRILDSMLLQNRVELTHDVLVTFMAEVTAIVNNRPLLPVSTDPESPCLLTPSTLLTMKTTCNIHPFPEFGPKDIRAHWKQVQLLADEFWKRWRTEYIHTLQVRHKWKEARSNLKTGDVILMKDSGSARNDWPMGIVQKTFPSDDGRIRKVEICVVKDGTRSTYVRPISELVTLLEV
ncbi:uncharacterized protein LOC133178524 [Saccostrea echinata]|uniref:uncharacterized protein LOC133178524 n=1 Tax=Saccostrea echinata TaxID=191078 RepID=UPI002A82A667|nr:uncharacterized protein LOC133178524 [Saccostrea echinata]